MMSYEEFLQKMDTPKRTKRPANGARYITLKKGQELTEESYNEVGLTSTLVQSGNRFIHMPFPRFIYEEKYDYLKEKYDRTIFIKINLIVHNHCIRHLNIGEEKREQLMMFLQRISTKTSNELQKYDKIHDQAYIEVLFELETHIKKEIDNLGYIRRPKKAGKKGNPELTPVIKEISVLLSIAKKNKKKRTNQKDACMVVRKINNNYLIKTFGIYRKLFSNIDGASLNDNNLLKRISESSPNTI